MHKVRQWRTLQQHKVIYGWPATGSVHDRQEEGLNNGNPSTHQPDQSRFPDLSWLALSGTGRYCRLAVPVLLAYLSGHAPVINGNAYS